MSVSAFPRVLLLTSSVFNHRSGGGITLTNLFSGWPRDSLAAAHSDTETPSTEVCDNYFRLDEAELGRSGLFEWLGRGPQQRGTLTPRLRDWIREFDPDVVYSLLGSAGYISLARDISDEFGAALVVHMMDDWPATIYSEYPFGFILRPGMNRQLRSIFRRADDRIAISRAMAAEYMVRYGENFDNISNPVDAEKWKALFPLRSRQAKKVLYVGSVIANVQLHALVDVATVIQRLKDAGTDVEFVIAFSGYLSLSTFFHGFSCVRLQDAPAEENVAELMISSDLLLLPASFEAESIRYLRLSNPTKIPAYMASGVPILVYAPPELDMVKRAREEGWAFCIATRNSEGLQAAIAQGLSDEVARQQVVTKAKTIAARDNDGVRVREAFRKLLQDASLAAQQSRAVSASFKS